MRATIRKLWVVQSNHGKVIPIHIEVFRLGGVLQPHADVATGV